MTEMECTAYQPVNKGVLLGRFNLYIPKWGVEIRGMTLLQKDGKRWVSFPQMEYEKDGKKKYWPYLNFKEHGYRDIFQDKAKRALDRFFSKPETSGSIFEEECGNS